MTLGMVEDSRMVLRGAVLLFVIEKAVLPGRWISMGWIFFEMTREDRRAGW
jgi:hypothetical protein